MLLQVCFGQEHPVLVCFTSYVELRVSDHSVFAEVVAALVWGWRRTDDVPCFQTAVLSSPLAALWGSLSGIKSSEGYSTASQAKPASLRLCNS